MFILMLVNNEILMAVLEYFFLQLVLGLELITGGSHIQLVRENDLIACPS